MIRFQEGPWVRDDNFSKPDEESDTQSVWKNILNPIKYSSNRVRIFLDSKMGRTGISVSYPSLT